jgi:hypothetical protein
MGYGWKRRLGVFATTAVLVGSLGVSSAGNAFAASVAGAPTALSWSGVSAKSDFCEEARKADANSMAILNSDGTGGPDWATLTATFQQLITSAPDELKPDLHKILDQLLVLNGTMSPAQASRPANVAQFGEAVNHYWAYVRSHCAGFDH